MNSHPLATMLLCLSLGLAAQGADVAKSTASTGPWIDLFDGKSTTGWRGFGKTAFPEQGWTVKDGWLTHVAKGGGGDIITDRLFTDFELRFERQIHPGGHSGVKSLTHEARQWGDGP